MEQLGTTAQEFGFNPSEPREPDGKWSGGGGIGGALRKGFKALSKDEAKKKGYLHPDGSAPGSGGAAKAYPDRVSTDGKAVHYEYDDGELVKEHVTRGHDYGEDD